MAWSRQRAILWPLVGGVVLAVVVLGTVMFRSSFQLEQLRERSVVEATLSLANEKADRLEKKIIDQDTAIEQLTEDDSIERFGQRWLEVAATQTPTVRATLLVDISDASHEVVAYASRAPGPDDDRFRHLVLGRFWPELNLDGPDAEQLRHLHTSTQESSYLLSHWQRQRDDRTYLVLVWHDVPRIVHDVFPELYGNDENGSAEDEVDEDAEAVRQSRVNVVDSEGRIVYGPPLSLGALTLGRQFATTLYKWRVNVSMVAAETLAVEVERRRILEMALVGLSSLVVLVGLVVIVVAAARERRLAMLKSEFVANVSHELKTPLSLVRMFSEMLLTGRAPERKQREYLEIIVAESERLSALIDNVLDFARVERGRASYDFRRVVVAETVARAVDICRARAERQGITIELVIDDDAQGEGDIDERAVEIGLINLIDNALKYAKGTESVFVGLSVHARFFEVSVEDRGPGIPPSQRRRIFDRFVRGETTAGEGGRGSGIGLSLVAQIAEAHGGRAWVEEAEPRGARFVMTLRAPRRGA